MGVGIAVGIIIGVAVVNLVLLALNPPAPLNGKRPWWFWWTFYASRTAVPVRRGLPIEQGKECSAANAPSWLASEYFDPNDLVRGPLGSIWLLLFRIFCVGFFVFSMVWQFHGPSNASSGPNQPPSAWLTFYTNWTFMGFLLQALLGAFLAARHLFSSQQKQAAGSGNASSSSGGTQQLAPGWETGRHVRRFAWFETCYLICHITILSCAISLTTFYWATLWKGGQVNVDNVFRHGVNVGLMLIDFFTSRLPVYTYQLHGIIHYTTCYAVFMWIYFAAADDWVYSALGWDKSSAPAYWVALVVLLFISWGVMLGLAKLRDLLQAACRCGGAEGGHQAVSREVSCCYHSQNAVAHGEGDTGHV